MLFKFPFNKLISEEKLIFYLICFFTFFIFYQQVFVINIGASFKIYEFIALVLLISFCLTKRPKIYSKYSFILFLFFVIIPTFSYIYYLFNTDKELYYIRFPEAMDSFRTNIYLAPTIILLYYYFNWVTFNYIVSSKLVYINKKKIIRLFVISGTLIAIYNFYAFVFIKSFGFPDLIPPFLDFRNSPTQVTGRFCGFSDEPGTYIVLQTWVVYYLFFYQHILNLKHILLLRVINGVALLMTFSSMLVPVILIGGLAFYLKAKLKSKLIFIVFIFIFVHISVKVISHYNLNGLFYYVIVEKVSNYFSPPDNTLDSGAYRSFTTRLGIKIFEEYPVLGCGGGASCFFIWKNENKVGIKQWKEVLSSTSYPQNCYSKVLAELGIIGGGTLIIFYVFFLIKCWRYRKKNALCVTSFWGTLCIIVILNSVYPETSMYLWFNIALAANELFFIEKKKTEKSISENEYSSYRL